LEHRVDTGKEGRIERYIAVMLLDRIGAISRSRFWITSLVSGSAPDQKKTRDTRLKTLPLFSRATSVFAKVGFDRQLAMAAISRRCDSHALVKSGSEMFGPDFVKGDRLQTVRLPGIKPRGLPVLGQPLAQASPVRLLRPLRQSSMH